MEELTEEQLQQLLEHTFVANEYEPTAKEKSDLDAYQQLFTALKAEPVQGLPYYFAATVRRTVQQRLNRKSDLRFIIFAIILVCTALTASYGLLELINRPSARIISDIVLKMKWTLSIVVLALAGLIGLEQRFVERKY